MLTVSAFENDAAARPRDVTGAELLVQSAVAGGVDTVFANPGTTELPLVAAIDSQPGLNAVLGLFEGVCTGAADGYGRMARRPALTLLHLGPGLANGIANLHNARRARSPVVNLVGDHATWHRDADPPLNSDIELLARPVSAWVRTAASAAELGQGIAQAIAAALDGIVATLVVPADCQWNTVETLVPAVPWEPARLVAPPAVDRAAELLRSGRRTALLLGGQGLLEGGLTAAARIAAGTGCRLLRERFPARWERGLGLIEPDALAYFPELLARQLGDLEVLILAGAAEPVCFFAYPGQPSRPLSSGTEVQVLAQPEDDAVAALEALSGVVGAEPDRPAARPAQPAVGPLTPEALGRSLAALQPEEAIVADESITAGAAYLAASAASPRHTLLSLTGGAIGQGLPCAIGAAVACRDRRVVALVGDGSAMYTFQGLWTLAHEDLDVTVIVCANRAYAILRHELGRLQPDGIGPEAQRLTALEPPCSTGWLSPAAWVYLRRAPRPLRR
jgi:acetolactate synthase-1/2/3 large subunit